MRFLRACCLFFLLTPFAHAYDRVKRTLNVDLEQKRLDAIAANGVSLGGFEFFPVMGVGEEYNDNIVKSEVLVLDDFITHVSPGFKARSNWNRHLLSLDVRTDLAFYARNSEQNYNDVTVDFNSRLDVLRDSALHFSTFFGHLHEDRQAVEQQGGLTPTIYNILDLDTAYIHKFNRFSVAGYFDVSRRDYQNVELITGVIRDNQDRDRWDYVPALRLGYEIQPQYEVFLKGYYANIQFDQTRDRHGQERSSQGGDVVIGLDFDATGLITGDAAIGYRHRVYDDPGLEDIGGVTGWLSLQWNITPLMTIYSKVTQDIGETTLKDVSGYNITTVNLGIEHELLRSLLLKLDGGYAHLKYQGYDASRFTSERKENRYFVGFSGKYTLNRYFYMDLSYRYSARNSNRPLNDYDQNRVFLNFVARM